MNLSYRFFLTLLVSLISYNGFSQAEIVEKVFSSKPLIFRSEVEIVDTIVFNSFYVDQYEGYSYETTFGSDDFETFLVYRHKTLNKLGLIIYDKGESVYTEPVADSISFLKALDYEYIEEYDELGNFVAYKYLANNLYFQFKTGSKQHIWRAAYNESKYELDDLGEAKVDLFKAVSIFSNADGAVNATFVNLRTGKVVNSSVLNENFVAGNAYYYDYSYYGGEYYEGEYYEEDYAYSEEEGYTEPAEASGYYESGLNYGPVEFTYFEAGDSISALIDYEFAVYSGQPLVNVVPEDFQGVWSIKGDESFYIIINGDDIATDYATYIATVDAFEGAYEIGTYSWDEVIKKAMIAGDALDELQDGWKGPKSGIKYISTTGWTDMTRFGEVFIQNSENLAHIYHRVEGNNVFTEVDFYSPERIYSEDVVASYDEYNYVTVYRTASGQNLDLYTAGIEYYYYEQFAVAEKNTDKDGNLVLSSQTLGTINMKSYAAGNYYLGKLKISWVGDSGFGEGSKVVAIDQQPYKILDETGKVLAPDVATMYIESVEGLNMYVIYGKNGKGGVLGPDGTWLVKQEYETVAVASSAGDYYYEGRSFPIFFQVGQGTKQGLMDTKGNMIVPMEFDYVEVCQDEVIALKDGMMSLYSTTGKQILGPGYLAQGYYSSYADCYTLDTYSNLGFILLSKDGKVGAMNKKYEVIIPFEYTALMPSADGRSFTATNEEGKTGIIDFTGKVKVPFEYDMIYAFEYVSDRYVAGKNEKQGVIDGNGNVLVPINYHSIQSTSEWANNILLVYDANYYTNAIDTTGAMIIEASCGSIYYYSAFGIFSCQDGINYSFYDRTGTFLYARTANYIDPYNAYDNIQITSGDDYENPSYGAFDLATGDVILADGFESVYPIWVSDQMFLVGVEKGKIGIYDRTGKQLVKPWGIYLDNYFYDYNDGGYYVEISNKKGKSKIIQLTDFEVYYYYGE